MKQPRLNKLATPHNPTPLVANYNGISASLLKLISPAILESPCKVLNGSIQSGICPSELKLARVTPVHKSGAASDPNNFRPISVLPIIISKLLERHICIQLMLYLRSYNLIVSTQSGFRPHHSTESILIKMTDDWLAAMDQGFYTGAIFLDLRKAFDVVNHDLFITKLQTYGCSSSTLLFRSSEAIYQTPVKVYISQVLHLTLKYCVLEFHRAQFLALSFSFLLLTTYLFPERIVMAYLLMMLPFMLVPHP